MPDQPSPKSDEPEPVPNAWDRFEHAVDVALRSRQKPKPPKAKTESKRQPS